MAGHGPAAKLGKDNASPYKQSLGIRLFIAYALVYAGFVAINTVKPKLMGMEVALGQNLAVVYGMGLIVLAIVMGLVYNHMCTKKEDELNKPESDESTKETE
jgi:uncharacterized membrane protein (DUF485 family)